MGEHPRSILRRLDDGRVQVCSSLKVEPFRLALRAPGLLPCIGISNALVNARILHVREHDDLGRVGQFCGQLVPHSLDHLDLLARDRDRPLQRRALESSLLRAVRQQAGQIGRQIRLERGLAGNNITVFECVNAHHV